MSETTPATPHLDDDCGRCHHAWVAHETGQPCRVVMGATDAKYPCGCEEKRPAPRQEWTTQEMTAEFETIGFLAPFVVVRRRSDGVKGTLEFTHMPRVYFGWQEDH